MNNPDPSQPLLHTPTEVGQNQEYADRSATKKGYRTTPLRLIFTTGAQPTCGRSLTTTTVFFS